MVVFASLVAALLYLVPVVALPALRSRRGRALWEIALDIPLAVAIDLLVIMALARLVPLQAAVLISRPAWALAAAGVLVVRRRRQVPLPEWPVALGRREILLAVIAALLAVGLSLLLSRPYHIWDRGWHTPLVSAIRGQRIPFMNVYEPHGGLYYHFSGNVLAAELQTLSFAVINATLALSLAHDIVFGLLGVVIAWLLRAWGVRSITAAVAGAMAVLLSGPPALLLGGTNRPVGGYSYLSFLVTSFRPHVSLGALLAVGVSGAALARLRSPGAPLPLRSTAPVLLGCTALLALTDETSIGLLGLSLGVTWLVYPDIVHPKRATGIFVFVGLALALVLPNLAFAGALSPGAHSLPLTIVPWRSPGYHNPPLPLSNPFGRAMLFLDLLPIGAVVLGGALYLFRARGRGFGASFVFFSVLAAISAFGLTRVDVDGASDESHRFVVIASLLAPLVGFYWLAPWPPFEARPRRAAALAPALVIGVAALSAASTIEWIPGVAERVGHTNRNFFTTLELHAIDCRAEAGADLSSRPVPTYIARPIWYMYAGCEPIFAPAVPVASHWTLKIGLPKEGYEALRELHDEMVAPEEGLRVVCPTNRAWAAADPVCAYVTGRSACRATGSRIVECELSGPERAELLASRPPAVAPRRGSSAADAPQPERSNQSRPGEPR